MFPSISKCAPDTFNYTEFTADYSFSISVGSDIQLSVDGVPSSSTVSVNQGQKLRAEIKSAPLNGDVLTVPYSIDGAACSITLVNRYAYSAVFQGDNRSKRWWNYTPSAAHSITFRNTNDDKSLFRDLGYNAINLIDGFVGIPDPLTNTVYFYNEHGRLIDNIKFDAKPVNVAKYSTADDSFFLVCCDDGFVYRLNLNLQILQEPFLQGNDTGDIGNFYDWLFVLSFEEDLPLRGGIIEYNRWRLGSIASTLQPKVASTYQDKIWIGGTGKVWMLDASFNVLAETDITGTSVGIQAYDGGAVVTTLDGSAFRVSLTETITIVVPENPPDPAVTTTSRTLQVSTLSLGVWLSNPVLFGDSIAIAESSGSKLMLFDTTNFIKTEIPLDDFPASYICANSAGVYIAGHDLHTVRVFDGVLVSTSTFKDKVTFVEATSDGLLASHFLKNISVLDHSGKQSVIPLQSPVIHGGLTFIGSIPQKIVNLGEQNITPVVPPEVTYWADGIPFGPVTDGTIFSASALAGSAGPQSYPIIMGDTVFDLLIVAEPQSFEPRDIFIPTLFRDKEDVAQFDFIIPVGYPDSIASIDYGYLLKNFRTYLGEVLTAGDTLSVRIPVTANNTPTVSVLTYGNIRFHAAVSCEGVVTSSIQSTSAVINGGTTLSTTITEGGEYFIPPQFPVTIETDADIYGLNIVNLGGAFDAVNKITNLIVDDDNAALYS